MPTIWGNFSVNGIPRNDATVKLWSAGAFSSPPSKNDDIPSGNPLASGTTSVDNGSDGAYRFDAIASGSYYVSIEWNGSVSYQYHQIDDATGRGEVLATNYANLQQAINATPSGCTLYIPAGIYVIDASADYAWTDPSGGTHHGLIVQDKPISIIGAGQSTKLRAGAPNVEVLTILKTPSFSDGRAGRAAISEFMVDNPSNYGVNTGCVGITFDRARRYRLRNVLVGDPAVASGGFDVGIKYKSAYIQDVENCYIHNCIDAINANTSYPVSADGGATHALFIRGGEIQSNQVAIRASGSHECTIYGAVIEGNTSGCILNGCFQWKFMGCYWEQTGS